MKTGLMLTLSLPSLPSTNRYIQTTNCRINEGVLRANELYTYLTERNLPLVVCLSEDATKIVDRTQYDSATNQIIDFVPPISNEINKCSVQIINIPRIN